MFRRPPAPQIASGPAGFPLWWELSMKTTRDPMFWAARRLYRILSRSDRAHRDLLARAQHLLAEQAAIERTCRLLGIATLRGWLWAAERLRERLLLQAARVQQACAALCGDEHRDPAPLALPDL